jgi:hypothetical protein
MTVATCELIWLKAILTDMGIHHPQPMILLCDNQSSIHIAANPVFHVRTKYIEMDYHVVPEQVQAGTIRTQHVRTTQQCVNIFTKPLDALSLSLCKASWVYSTRTIQFEGVLKSLAPTGTCWHTSILPI